MDTNSIENALNSFVQNSYLAIIDNQGGWHGFIKHHAQVVPNRFSEAPGSEEDWVKEAWFVINNPEVLRIQKPFRVYACALRLLGFGFGYDKNNEDVTKRLGWVIESCCREEMKRIRESHNESIRKDPIKTPSRVREDKKMHFDLTVGKAYQARPGHVWLQDIVSTKEGIQAVVRRSDDSDKHIDLYKFMTCFEPMKVIDKKINKNHGRFYVFIKVDESSLPCLDYLIASCHSNDEVIKVTDIVYDQEDRRGSIVFVPKNTTLPSFSGLGGERTAMLSGKSINVGSFEDIRIYTRVDTDDAVINRHVRFIGKVGSHAIVEIKSCY